MSDPSVKSALERLTRRFAESLPTRVARIASDVESLLRAWDRSHGELAYRGMHGLVGSTGTYGFLDLFRIARRAELILKACFENDCPPSLEEEVRIRDLMDRLGILAAAAAQGFFAARR